MQRLAREWRFGEQNGDVGTIDLTIDVSSFPALPAGFTKYGIMIDADGDFSSGAAVYEVGLVAGSLYDVPNINIANGDYIAIVAIDPTVEFTLANSSGFEPVNAVIQIELNYITRTAVTVDYTTADGTASSAQPDYTAAIGSTATINAGSRTTNITIPINDDAVVESDEDFTITLSNPSVGIGLGATTVHTYTIHDDDDARKIYFDVATASGDESISPVAVNVSISSTSATDVSVDYAVIGGTATEGVGNDYVLASGTVTITGGSGFTTGSFTFTVNDDAIYENDETIIIRLSNPQGCNLDNPSPANVGTGFIEHTYTIIDNDTPPEIQFSVSSGSGDESVSPVSITVELNTTSQADASATYTVADVTAVNGSDYIMSSGTVTIPAGSLTANLFAIIIDDEIEELPESFTITLSAPVDASLGGNTVYTYTILDNDQFGYLGPGGVGDDDNNLLWLKADVGVYSDAGITPATNGSGVRQWNDQSGNGHHASQATAGNQSTYTTNSMNTRPVLRFDGSNDWMGITIDVPETDFSQFMVFRTIGSDGAGAAITITNAHSSSAGSHDRQFGLTGNNLGHRLWNNQIITSAAGFNDNNAHLANVNVNNSTGQNIYANGTSVATGNKTSSDFNTQTHMLIGGHNAWGFLNADISEIVYYSTVLNDAQRTIVNNYLAAKYGLTIANDLYAYEGSYGYDVAGIGREDANNFHLDAQGGGIVRINNASSMDDNDYMFWGHDNVGPSSGALTTPWSGKPAGVNNALHRVWRVDETGDMGTVTVMFDVSSLTIGNSSDLALLIDSDDGDFVNATVVPLSSYSAPYATFNAVDFNDGDWFTIGSLTSANPLPIELLNFYAKLIEDEVHLNWITASEINNDFFTIERSKDGINFEKVSIVNGAGNSSSIREYRAIDKNPYEGLSYYRLKQTDFDGKYEYSNMVAVQYIKEEQVRIFPNPVSGSPLYLSTNATEEREVLVVLYDALGAIVYSKIIVQPKGFSTATIDIEGRLSPGVYLVVCSNENELFRQKLVIE